MEKNKKNDLTRYKRICDSIINSVQKNSLLPDSATLKKLFKEKGLKIIICRDLKIKNDEILEVCEDQAFYGDVSIESLPVENFVVFKQPFLFKDEHLFVAVVYDNSDTMRTIDLFAGIGGVRLGFENANAGFKTVFANDFEKSCGLTYNMNFSECDLMIEDIRTISVDDLPEFDFLLGGFPCQAFSIAGYRDGFEDKKNRGGLFFDVARILKARHPMGFMLENVKNLQSHDNGKTYKIIKEALESLGYKVKEKVLNSMEYGNVPQNRERIYIVGFLDHSIADRFEWPDKIKLTKTIHDCLEVSDIDKKYYYSLETPLGKQLDREVVKRDTVYQWRRIYVRENKNNVCPTLTANMGMGGHNVPLIRDTKGVRKLTPRECANFQGFPSDYKLPKIADSLLYKQFGNSVSIPVIERIAKQIRKAIYG
jgi:DNA (cytosine-5)-methyltransferase 1